MRKSLLFISLTLLNLAAFAQGTQTVKGIIIDKDSKSPLAMAVIACTDDANQNLVAEADSAGNFIIKNVPVGKHQFVARYVGYNERVLTNIEVNSGKQVDLTVEMEESVKKNLGEVKIGARKTGETINEMATVSTRTFDVHETERYAGSRQDPARMASNFAGVQGTDDSRNDIVVRGNSPLGVLWRFEDIDIFNPNHFAIPGSSGGPLSIINNKYLSNSDFMTGAFAAEYGNAVASVFDLHMRNGNKDKVEFTGQVGILGTEAAIEGPLSKKHKASFIATYRYSNFNFLQKAHIPIGTKSIPEYQDASLRLNFPIGKKSKLAFFAIGGISNIDLIVHKDTVPPTELYGENDRDQYFASSIYVAGASFSHIINPKTFTKITIANQGQAVDAHHDRVYRDSAYKVTDIHPIMGYHFGQSKWSISWFVNHKINSATTLKAGIHADRFSFNYKDSIREFTPNWKYRWNYEGSAFLIQPYVQMKHSFNEKFFMTAGLHAQYYTGTNSKSLEPRIGFNYSLPNQQKLTLGYGLHSQMQPYYTYFYRQGTDQPSSDGMYNKNMDFTRSHQVVLGYEKQLNPFLRIKAETYYQYLYNVPIETRAGSSFSILNEGSGFSRMFPDTLVNKGYGQNKGIELTVEKFFNKGYFFLLTGSLYDSKAKGNDNAWRNTDFNGQYAANAVAGTEKKIGKSSFNVSGKLTIGGGKRFSPIDTMASRIKGEMVVVDAARNTKKMANYFRFDMKLGWKYNSHKYGLTHEIAIDLINVTGHKNELSYTYQPDNVKLGIDPVVKQYQLGFLPLLYYKIDF